MVKFDNKAKEKLITIFPDVEVLQRSYDISKKERVIQHIRKLLKYADTDKLYPYYIMLVTSTGRFLATKPELHNLNRKPPAYFTLKNERAQDYNVRDLLLGAPKVFTIEFSTQEDECLPN